MGFRPGVSESQRLEWIDHLPGVGNEMEIVVGGVLFFNNKPYRIIYFLYCVCKYLIKR